MESPSKVPGAKRIRMRYGPYLVPNMNRTGLTGEPGSLWLANASPYAIGSMLIDHLGTIQIHPSRSHALNALLLPSVLA
jgi:hypothetical protein